MVQIDGGKPSFEGQGKSRWRGVAVARCTAGKKRGPFHARPSCLCSFFYSVVLSIQADVVNQAKGEKRLPLVGAPRWIARWMRKPPPKGNPAIPFLSPSLLSSPLLSRRFPLLLVLFSGPLGKYRGGTLSPGTPTSSRRSRTLSSCHSGTR